MSAVLIPLLVVALVLLDLAALRWGVDSRDWSDRRRDW
jgi:hypothetical protein